MYYDARVVRWEATDPLFEKHINYTTYNYILDSWSSPSLLAKLLSCTAILIKFVLNKR